MRQVKAGYPAVLLLASVALGMSLAGCRTQQIVEVSYPSGDFSAGTIDFGEVAVGAYDSRTVWFKNNGELPMGIEDIVPGEEDQSGQFEVSWIESEMDCPVEDTSAEVAAKGRGTMDSGGHTQPPEDTSEEPQDTSEPEEPTGEVMVMGPGCRLPVHITYRPTTMGKVWGSYTLSSRTEDAGENASPTYFADPLRGRIMLYVTGTGKKELPNIVVNPRTLDFGHVWTAEEEVGYISISNTGEADLHLQSPVVDDSCDPGFSIVNLTSSTFQSTLESGESTFVQVNYSPIDTEPAYCQVEVESDDPDTPSIDVNLQGNAGEDPANRAPTVYIRSPGVGYRTSTRTPFEMELNVYDVNQPATSLVCKVKSMVLALASVASCTPTDESGHVVVTVDPDDIGTGVDTLRVQVTDSSEVSAYASITVLVDANYPDSDDDGDGWGETPDEEGLYDCDDTNVNTYPFGAEVPDGDDNDCDGVVDETTTNYDDDGDTYTEADGDCNDLDEDIYPDALEQPDSKDNDCDGTLDEDTSLFDDDGDGYTEMNNDCDDGDPTINPSAIEYCDGDDNDCNGLMDSRDGCIPLDSEPYIVGGIQMQQTSCEEGDQVTLSVLVYDGDGQSLDYAWTGDEGLVIDPLTGSSTVTVTCPELSSNDAKLYSLYVIATDEDGNQTWDFDDIAVYPKGALYVNRQEIVVSGGKCSTGGGGAGLGLAGLALGLVGLRRRQRRS